MRDVRVGEELTDDYGTLNIEDSFECYCGEETYRGIICPDDLLRHAPAWDQLVRASLPYVRAVEQPIWPMVRQKRKIERAVADHSLLPSLATHYCPVIQGAEGW